MPDTRSAIKLDFTTGLEALPPRPKMDAATTEASLDAGRQLGFSGRTPKNIVDGRSLRSKGAHAQLNLKVTPEDKARIVMEANRLIQDSSYPIGSIGEFVVMAVDFYRANYKRQSRND